MVEPDKKIIEFLKKHHVLTLSTTIDYQPWCANCFYAFNEHSMNLIFTSGYETRHIRRGRKIQKLQVPLFWRPL